MLKKTLKKTPKLILWPIRSDQVTTLIDWLTKSDVFSSYSNTLSIIITKTGRVTGQPLIFMIRGQRRTMEYS